MAACINQLINLGLVCVFHQTLLSSEGISCGHSINYAKFLSSLQVIGRYHLETLKYGPINNLLKSSLAIKKGAA